MALAATLVKRHSSGMGLVAKFSIAASGSYTTGGMVLDLAAIVGYTNRQPDFVEVIGLAGYKYAYDLANKKLIIFQSPAVTPAGSISKPTFTVKSGAIGTDMGLGLTADAATADLVGGVGITTNRTLLVTTTPVGAPTFTGSASTAAALGELPATTLPVDVSGDTIIALGFWIPTPSLNT